MKKTPKPRGAPKKDNPASSRFEGRCTPEEKIKWQAAAKKSDMKLGEWLKYLANKNA